VLEVLRGASFALGAGEMAAVAGASGAGKTTLLHVLGGLERADAGSARLGDFDILGAGPSELARFRRRDVGFVFQSHHLLPDLSAEENVALPLLIGREGWAGARRAAGGQLAALGREGRAAHPAPQR
jgi:lipoprotein-releasing system ATP-binding protein